MVDGFKCTCIGVNAADWGQNKNLDFIFPVSERTGEILKRKEAKYKSLTFSISPNVRGGLSCVLSGSLHKYKNNGLHNYDNFTIDEICKTLDGLACNFGVNLESAVLHSLEIGVNVPLNYKPQRVIKSIICHKGTPFKTLSVKGEYLGAVCEHSDYDIKIYDKSYQQRTATGYILRYEIKFKRIRLLNDLGIKTLLDLKKPECLGRVLPFLLAKLNEIVFFDFYTKIEGLTDGQKLRWERFSNPNFWQRLNRKQYYKARVLFAKLSRQYGANNGAEILANKVSNIYQNQCQSKHKKGGRFPRIKTKLKAQERGTFSHLEYVLENVTSGDIKNNKKIKLKNNTKKDDKKNMEKRFCKICGRDITRQKLGSVFCSEKYYGKEAKKCRNRDSNKRRDLKRKIYRAMEKEQMLQITYVDKHGKTYTDILGAKEVFMAREWLDNIKEVVCLDSDNKTLKDKEAQRYLQTLNQ